MDKIKKLCIAFALLLGIMGSILTVNAASAVNKNICKKIVESMPCIAVIDVDGFNEYSWKFDDRARAVMAAGSIKNGKEINTTNEEYSCFQISNKDYQKAVRDLFGSQKAVLSAKSLSQVSEIIDAYKTAKGDIVVCSWNLEFENDYEVKSTSFENVSASKYKYTEDVYWGYWGNLDRSANYRVEYTFILDKSSSYGCIVTDIKVLPIQKQSNGNKIGIEKDKTVNQSAFYGIWVGASKNEADAKKIASQYKDLDGCVFLSTDWGNLNKEPYYVVTCGTYNLETEAKQMLAVVKKMNKNAYIKYSGEYLR